MARKSWADLSPAYRHRLEKAGLGPDSPLGSRAAARGHGTTPEHPERAEKQQARYRDYLKRRNTLEQRVIAHKQSIFGHLHEGRHKYDPSASRRAVRRNPNTKLPPRRDYMERALKFRSYDEMMMNVDWTDDEWGFLYYHPGK